MSNDFYLVQRLELRDPVDETRGFDGYFRCEYMGSAEFEFGAIPASLKRIRQAGPVRVMKTLASCQGVNRKVYFVCHPGGFVEMAPAFREWVSDGCRGKENSHFRECFAKEFGTAWLGWRWDTIAWWSLDNDVLFTLDENVAGRLVKAVNGKAVKS